MNGNVSNQVKNATWEMMDSGYGIASLHYSNNLRSLRTSCQYGKTMAA